MLRIDARAAEAIAIGAGILGTGGGGNPYLGLLMTREMLRRGADIALVAAADVPDDAVVCGIGSMGAPTVGIEKLPRGDEPLAALRALEGAHGRRVTHLIAGRDRRRERDAAAHPERVQRPARRRRRRDGAGLPRVAALHLLDRRHRLHPGRDRGLPSQHGRLPEAARYGDAGAVRAGGDGADGRAGGVCLPADERRGDAADGGARVVYARACHWRGGLDGAATACRSRSPPFSAARDGSLLFAGRDRRCRAAARRRFRARHPAPQRQRSVRRYTRPRSPSRTKI